MNTSQDLPLNNRYHERDVDLSTERDPSDRPSIGRRMFRALSRFSIAVLFGVAATLAWQSHGDEAKEMFRTWVPSLAWLLPVSATTSAASASLPQLAQQLESMARDLAIVRRGMEQLAANVAKLHAVENPSSGRPSWADPILPRTPPQPAAKASAVSPPPPPARQPFALR